MSLSSISRFFNPENEEQAEGSGTLPIGQGVYLLFSVENIRFLSKRKPQSASCRLRFSDQYELDCQMKNLMNAHKAIRLEGAYSNRGR